jgi:ATP-dependent exoDNAse (exonuclease V) beta subunit
LDIRLLYVAMTRALHELTVFSAGEPNLDLHGKNVII